MALRMTTAGESHGPGLTCILEGIPAGLAIEREGINRDLHRRQLGHGRGGRMKIERDQVEESPVRCLNAEASAAMVEEINRLRKANESLGGVFEVRAFGLVPGIGSHVSWDRRLDGRLGQAILSIQALKGVSIGDGFEVAGVPGSEAHDEIFWAEDRGYYRQTNRAGGLEGGITTGDPLVVRGWMKPLPTLTKPLRSVDISTHEPAEALRERTDSATVPAAGVVGEAMVAFVLADAYRRKFGGDHIDDVRGALRAYQQRIGWRATTR